MAISDIDPAVPGDLGAAGQGDDELRQLKSDVKECFPGVDGEITNPNGTGDPGDLTVPDAATWTELFNRVYQLEQTPGGTILPNMITIWSGNVADIPAGWALCDGNTYNSIPTPNLTDKFVMGAGASYNPGDEGGSVGSGTTGPGGDHNHGGTLAHAITVSELPNELNTSALKVVVADSTQADSHDKLDSVARGSVSGNSANATPMRVDGASGAGHTHGMAGSGTHTHDLTGALPPYYALAYIMFVGEAP